MDVEGALVAVDVVESLWGVEILVLDVSDVRGGVEDMDVEGALVAVAVDVVESL